MKIKQISVTGLFGIFDHVIPLNIEERITIIHSLNGFGKTNILRILNGIFNSQYSYLKDIPFKNFKIEFSDYSSLSIEKKVYSSTLNSTQCNLLFVFNRLKSEPLFLELTADWIDKIINLKKNKTIEFQKKRFRVRKKLELQNLIQDNSPDIEPEWLEELKNNINLRLIESQRLLNINDSYSSSMLPTVSAYSQEIAKVMQDKFAEYAKVSQSLDRTFPVRAVQKHKTDLTDEQLREQLNELENICHRLIKVDLLDKDENQNFSTQFQDIDESTRNILSIYVADTKKKLSIFDEIANKLELLKNIINRKFAYSYKEMNFSKEEGFVFTTCYSNAAKSYSKTLLPTDLSSGEQHELVLLYELLFKVEPNSLVLIDEPELSLHVGWQSQFLKDLQEITKLADLDILIATHSPDIIQDRWDDLTVELKAPGK